MACWPIPRMDTNLVEFYCVRGGEIVNPSSEITLQKEGRDRHIPLGLILFFQGFLFLFVDFIHRWLIPPMLVLSLFGIITYLWGCLALAKAKGYSTAIVLTVILGVLFPAVVLLALPDKNRRHKRN